MAKTNRKARVPNPNTFERARGFERYDDIRKELMTTKEIAIQDCEVRHEIDVLRAMQNCVTQAVTAYMADKNIGFNELTRRLKTSTRQIAKILKGEANLTLATIAELASIIGKHARIVFDDGQAERPRRKKT